MHRAGQPLHHRNCPVWWSTYQEGLIVATTDLFSTQVELESYQIASSLREYTATSLAVCPCVSPTSHDSLKLTRVSLFGSISGFVLGFTLIRFWNELWQLLSSGNSIEPFAISASSAMEDWSLVSIYTERFWFNISFLLQGTEGPSDRLNSG